MNELSFVETLAEVDLPLFKVLVPPSTYEAMAKEHFSLNRYRMMSLAEPVTFQTPKNCAILEVFDPPFFNEVEAFLAVEGL